MSQMNVIVLQGNLVADPILHGENDSVAKFTLANNTGFGENAQTHFIDCVAFGKQVETIKNHLTKGKEIVVRGKLMQNKWEFEDDNGETQKRSKMEIRLESFEGFSFTSGGKRSDEEKKMF